MKICVVWDDVFGESSTGYVDLGPVASWRSSRALTVETWRVLSRDTEPLFVEALDFNLCHAFSIIKEREASLLQSDFFVVAIDRDSIKAIPSNQEN